MILHFIRFHWFWKEPTSWFPVNKSPWHFFWEWQFNCLKLLECREAKWESVREALTYLETISVCFLALRLILLSVSSPVIHTWCYSSVHPEHTPFLREGVDSRFFPWLHCLLGHIMVQKKHRALSSCNSVFSVFVFESCSILCMKRRHRVANSTAIEDVCVQLSE